MKKNVFKKKFEQLLSVSEGSFAHYFKGKPEEANNFLFAYFDNDTQANSYFIGRLLHAHPQLLLESIRLQQVPFLRPNHWEVIKEAVPSTHHLIDWINFLDFVKNEELLAWQNFTDIAQKCLSIPLVDVFIYVSWWYESKRLNGHEETASWITKEHEDNRRMREHAKNVIEHFLVYYCNHSVNATAASNASDLRYIELFKTIGDNPNQALIFDALEALYLWNHFKISMVDMVCFDLNFELNLTHVHYSLYPKSILKEMDWHLDGHKYMAMHLSYVTQGYNIASALTLQGHIPNIQHDYGEYNIAIAAEGHAVQRMMDDFCITGFEFESSRNGQKVDFPIQLLVQVMAAFCVNARARFVDPVDKLLIEHKVKDWKKRLLGHVLQLPSKHYHLSVREYSLDGWKEVISKQFNISQKEQEHLAELLMVDLNQLKKKKQYNRFNSIINLAITPFIRIDQKVFSFPNILGEVGQWGYSLLQSALDKHANKRQRIANVETKVKMEAQLGQQFLDQGFERVLYSKEYKFKTKSESLKSDIDLLVYDSGILLIGELKRTKLRLSLKDAWLERSQTNQKAVLQLQKHLRVLKDYPAFFAEQLGLPLDFDFSAITVVPLIFSTSFEEDGQYFGDQKNIQKVSCFEIGTLLEELGEHNSNSEEKWTLKELVEQIRKRYMWKDLLVGQPKYWNNVEISIPVESVDPEKVQAYNTSTTLANEAYDNKQYNIALAHFFEALQLTPDCPYIMESLGNAFSGLSRFDDAEVYYNKALEKIPDSYDVLRNSAHNYLDNQKYDNCVKQIFQIMDWYGGYPIVRDNIRRLLMLLYVRGGVERLSSKEAFEEKLKLYHLEEFL